MEPRKLTFIAFGIFLSSLMRFLEVITSHAEAWVDALCKVFFTTVMPLVRRASQNVVPMSSAKALNTHRRIETQRRKGVAYSGQIPV